MPGTTIEPHDKAARGAGRPSRTELTEIVLPGVVGPDGLIVSHRSLPTPGAGQVLVEMLATGVSFAENSMRRNRYPGQPRFPFVLGYDLVGVVTSVGSTVATSMVGQRVAAVTKSGAWSSHVVLDPLDLLAVPAELDPAEVESLLLNGITAWQMLHRSANVKAGGSILVHGASGGVGVVLVQLARHAGLRVIGTASGRNQDLLRSLGVDPIDYRDPRLVEQVRALAPAGVDAVFDNIGGDSFRRSFHQLAPGGTLVGYGTASQVDDPNNLILTFVGILARFMTWTLLPNAGRSATFYNFWAGRTTRPTRFRRHQGEDLAQVLALLADGTITPRIAARFPLQEAARALALASSGTTSGKIVITPPSAAAVST